MIMGKRKKFYKVSTGLSPWLNSDLYAMKDWVTQNFGKQIILFDPDVEPRKYMWFTKKSYEYNPRIKKNCIQIIFYFRNEEDAALFALKWT